MAVGLGGGHNGFSVALLHLMNPNDAAQHVYVDTPKIETPSASTGGFFRQSWGTQVLELQKFASGGDPARVHFAGVEGTFPPRTNCRSMGIRLFVGVGHETTGATTYNETDVRNLLEWLDRDPDSHHALIDGTSMLGAMPLAGRPRARSCWRRRASSCRFRKPSAAWPAISPRRFTPQAIALIEKNLRNPAWAIPRHLKLAVPRDAKRPLTGEQTTSLGPFYDPAQDKMLGGIINTFSNTAFAETTFGLISMQKRVGSVRELNRQSAINRAAVDEWLERHLDVRAWCRRQSTPWRSRYAAASERLRTSPIRPFTSASWRKRSNFSAMRTDSSGRHARARAGCRALCERVSRYAGRFSRLDRRRASGQRHRRAAR